MFRTTSAAVLVAFAFVVACGDNGSPPLPTPPPSNTVAVRVTPPPKPTSVPEAAQGVGQTTTLGRITRRAEEEPQTVGLRELEDATCQNELVILATSEETIYAAIPCDRFWDDRAKDLFVGEQVAIVLEVSEERFRVLIETLGAAKAEFTVDGIWVE